MPGFDADAARAVGSIIGKSPEVTRSFPTLRHQPRRACLQLHHRAVRRRQHRPARASATRSAAGAMLYCASAIRSQSRKLRDASTTSRSCSARSPRSSAAMAPSASFGVSSTQAGNSRGIDASVGGKLESNPILPPCATACSIHGFGWVSAPASAPVRGRPPRCRGEGRAGEQDRIRAG